MPKLKKKYSFVLLELLIAMTLFSLCVIPFVQFPFRTLRDAIHYYQRLELERLTDITLTQIETQLFQNSIPWGSFECNRKNKYLFPKEVIAIDVTGEKKALFEKTCALWTSRKKKGKNGENYRLLTLEIAWKPQPSKKNAPPIFKRHHQVLVQQLPSQTRSNLIPPSLPDPLPQTARPPMASTLNPLPPYATIETS